ncbi:MAG: L,D-transpeptidase family protein [Ignavibacteriales bacterium]
MRRPVRIVLWVVLVSILPFVCQPDPPSRSAEAFAPPVGAGSPAGAGVQPDPTAPADEGEARDDAAPVAADEVPDSGDAAPVAADEVPGAAADDGLKVVIDLRALTLTLMRGESAVKWYPVAAGKPSNPSPTGRFVISAIVKYPTWFPRGRSPVPPGPSNPLGSRWIGLSNGVYGIHGTNDDSSIGKYVSKGCIRMHNADVEELCRLVRVGIPVVLTDTRLAGDAAAGDQPEPAKDAGDSRRSGRRPVE